MVLFSPHKLMLVRLRINLCYFVTYKCINNLCNNYLNDYISKTARMFTQVNDGT